MRQGAKASLLIAALWAVTAATAAADDPHISSATQPAAEEKMIQLNFPQNMEVKVLVEYVSKRLDINILYDESVGRKRITLLSPAKIPESSLMGLFESILKMSGLQLVDAEQKGWKKLVQARNFIETTKGLERDPEELTGKSATTPVSQVFQLKNTTTAEVDRMIKPFLTSPGGNTFSLPDRNTIIITDYAGNIRRMATLIELLDAPRPEAELEFIPVKHVNAGDLAKRVTALLQQKADVAAGGKGGQVDVRLIPEDSTNQIVMVSAKADRDEALRLIRELDVAPDVEMREYSLKYVSPSRVDRLARDLAGRDGQPAYRSTIDAESGLLIISAPSRVHEQIASLVERLDREIVDPTKSYVRFYKLMNTTASHVLGTIRALESGGEGLAGLSVEQLPPIGGSAAFTGPNKPALGANVGRDLPKPPGYKEPDKDGKPRRSLGQLGTAGSRDAVVTADTNTNTIIVVASPDVQRVYAHLIKILDKRRPQVMIEATLVTLDTSGSFSLGVEIGGDATLGSDARTVLFSSFGLSTPDPDTGQLTLKPGVGFNGVLLSPDIVDVVIKALKTSGRAKVLSAPRVLVNDNSSATLSSVSEAPFTSVNASNTVSTTSFAGYASAGTTIAVTPHISEGDHLQLHYSVTLNSFTGSGSAGVPPPRQTNTVNSEVTVPDGHGIIVGGLTRRDISDTESRVPWLGDVPILKHLVGTTDKQYKESTLFVFLRPVILRDDEFEDLKYLSAVAREDAELPDEYPQSQPMIMR